MHLVYPQKFCITIVSNFSWVLQVVPREIEDIGYAKFWGVNKVHYGLCENGELPIMAEVLRLLLVVLLLN